MSASTCWSTSSSPSLRSKVVLFSLFCGALFTAVVGTMGLKFVMELYATDQVSADLEAPRWIVFSAVPAGSYLMCFRFLQVAWAFYGPASCRTTTRAASRASRSTRRPASGRCAAVAWGAR